MSVPNNKNDLRLRISKNKSGHMVYKSIIKHPMETGHRRDHKSGQLVPADFIEKFSLSVDGVECIDMRLSANISRNPFFGFDLPQQIKDGQLITVTWIDNRGERVSYDSMVAFDAKHAHNFIGIYNP